MQNIVIVLVGLVLITLIIIFISKSIRTMIPSLIAFYFLILISLFTYNSKQVESFYKRKLTLQAVKRRRE
jgi:c-di-AMP phosphodiesterase-like protein